MNWLFNFKVVVEAVMSQVSLQKKLIVQGQGDLNINSHEEECIALDRLTHINGPGRVSTAQPVLVYCRELARGIDSLRCADP